MSELASENTPVSIEGLNLSISEVWKNAIRVQDCQKEDLEPTIKGIVGIIARGDSKTFDEENKRMVREQARKFFEEDLDSVLKGEQRAFKEMRLSIRDQGFGKYTIFLIDNMENRVLKDGGLKEWFIDSSQISNKPTFRRLGMTRSNLSDGD